jgi:hypothetical protein
MFSIGLLPNQPSVDWGDFSTPVFHKVLVIGILSPIVESVFFPLPMSLTIWHASHELLNSIPTIEDWKTQSGVFFLQNVGIVHLYDPLLDCTLDILVHFTCHIWAVEMGL